MQEYPKQIKFQSIRPKGYTSKYKQWPIDPLSSNAFWNPNDIVRFQLMHKQGVMDPYRSYFRIQVSTPSSQIIGGVQVDSSAQSFISQVVTYSNNAQIQRITQYDTLAAYLTDIGFSQIVTQGRDLQGLGMSCCKQTYHTNQFPRTGNCVLSNVWNSNNNQWTACLQGATQTIMPTRSFSQLPVITQGVLPGSLGLPNQLSTGHFDLSGQTGNQLSSSIFFNQASELNVTQPSQYQSSRGTLPNTRVQYLAGLGNQKYPDSSNTTSKQGFIFPNTASWNSNPNNTPYIIQQNSNTSFINFLGNQIPYVNNPQITGFQTPYSPFTSKGCFQPIISNTIPLCGMQNGQLLNKKIPVNYKTFLIPFISSICGILIPASSYTLIPMQALYNLLLQVTLSPYAMFSTGYPDRNQIDINGMQIPIPRAYKINRMQYILVIYQFAQQAIRQYISSSLLKGINSTNMSWMLGAQYQLPNGQVIRNSWQVSSGCQSLCQVVCLFLSNQYQSYPFCRKQFRLSNNITSMQLKFNTDYYPPQPIVGHAGNPQTVDQWGDNAQFMLLLLKSSNYLFNVNSSLSRINRINFAINSRCYDPTNQQSHYKSSVIGTPINTWAGSLTVHQGINCDTALGFPYFHQNRYVGRAAFVYSFQPFAHSKNYMMGLDTRGSRPFQILFNNAPNGTFPTDQTMYVFLRHNILVRYTNNGITVIGR